MGPRAGLDGQKISPPPGFDPGPSSPVAQLLYRLSYRAHILYRLPTKTYIKHNKDPPAVLYVFTVTLVGPVAQSV